MSTIRGLMAGRVTSPGTLPAVAWAFGWPATDLAVIMGPDTPLNDTTGLFPCHHVGKVIAAAPLTTEELHQAIAEADRMRDEQTSERDVCPDIT